MIEQIRNYLMQNYVKVSNVWLAECIEFIKSEYGINNTGNLLWMKEKVYEQWLYSDLTTLEMFCLPLHLSGQNLTTIKGHFPLQVNHLRDVGLPAYSQFQKLCSVDAENINVSADKVHTAAWEPKPSRMLLLELTDGTSVVQGMEYRPISSLSLTMKPGIKILIKGSIEVRRGMLLLTKDNVTVLGGEVETLLVSNAPENILRKTLNLQESEDPIPVPNSLEQQSVSSTQEQQSQYYNTQATQSLPPTCQPRNIPNPRCRQVVTAQPKPPLISRVPPIPTSNDEFGDTFDDFMDSEMEMALIEAEQKASVAASQHPKKAHVTAQPTLDTFNSNSNKSNNSMNKNGFVSSNTLPPSHSRSFFPTSTNNHANHTAPSNPPRPSLSSSLNDEPFADDDDDLLLLAASQIPETTNTSSVGRIDSSNSTAKPSCVIRPLIKSTPITYSTSSAMQRKERPDIPGFVKNEIDNNRLANHHGTSLQIPSTVTESFRRNSRDTSDLNLNLTQKKLSHFIFEKKATNNGVTVDSSSASLATRSKESIRIKIGDKPPYQYICHMNLTPLEKVSYTIFGFVTTLLSKLEQRDGKWHLTAKINDGTGSCDVDFDDGVLRQLMGMSVEEFMAQKEEALINPHIKNALGQRVCRCQMELIKMCSLLRVENAPSFFRPRVVGISSLTETHLRQLKERSNSL